MDKLKQILRVAKNFIRDTKKNCFKLPENYTKLRIILGNESCDLDSAICTLLLAYLKSHTESDSLILPILNVREKEFPIRTQITFVLKNANLPLDLLLFKDEVDLKEIVGKFDKSILFTSLVDHHVLVNQSDKDILGNIVDEIFDHRPLDKLANWSANNVKLLLKQVGSCATLITDEILKNKVTLDQPLAYLLYQTIVYDTIALVPEKGKAKDLDLLISKQLEEKFNFPLKAQQLFDQLWKVHYDVSSLTPNQLLLRDLKVLDEKIPIPGLPMLAENFLKLPSAAKAIKEFCDKYESGLVFLIGMDAGDGNYKRDFAIYYKESVKNLKNTLVGKLKDSENLFGYDLRLNEVKVEFDNVICFHQNNVKMSRKQIMPIITSAAKECNL